MVLPSSLLSFNHLSGRYDKRIGKGLFSLKTLRKGTRIAYYKGRLLTAEAMKQRLQRHPERRGYQLQITKNCFLDCYSYRRICPASRVNSPYMCYDRSRQRMASPCARLVVDTKKKRVSIKLIKDVQPRQEILVNYSRSFKWYFQF